LPLGARKLFCTPLAQNSLACLRMSVVCVRMPFAETWLHLATAVLPAQRCARFTSSLHSEGLFKMMPLRCSLQQFFGRGAMAGSCIMDTPSPEDSR
jgi:hypothetical protein